MHVWIVFFMNSCSVITNNQSVHSSEMSSPIRPQPCSFVLFPSTCSISARDNQDNFGWNYLQILPQGKPRFVIEATENRQYPDPRADWDFLWCIHYFQSFLIFLEKSNYFAFDVSSLATRSTTSTFTALPKAVKARDGVSGNSNASLFMPFRRFLPGLQAMPCKRAHSRCVM